MHVIVRLALIGSPILASIPVTQPPKISDPHRHDSGADSLLAAATDLIARIVGERLEKRFGKSFVIENRTGAGTTIAAVATAKAAPDGLR